TVVTSEGVTVNIDPNTGVFTYTPNAGFTGQDSFMYTICDDGTPQACDTATVYITVDGVAGLSIVKSASSTTTGCVGEGDLVTYIFTVTNSGDVLINSITITDDLLGGDITATLTLTGDNGDNILDLTETWVFTAPNYTVTQEDVDAGNITNNVTANGLELDGTTTVQATDTYVIDANNPDVTLCNESGIGLLKVGVFNNENGNDCSEIDETITYTFTVTNPGDIALENVTITDPLLANASPQVTIDFVSGDTDNDNQLDPTESWVYTATYLITQLDIDATEVTNIATVTAEDVVSGTSVSITSQTTTALVEDTTPPDTSNCAVLNETIECNGSDNETIANDWNAANILALENCVTDACDNNVTVTSNYAFGNLITNCGTGGTIEVTYTLTDVTGNASTFITTLTLEDTTGPDLTACTVTDDLIECSDNDNENLAAAWNANNIAILETCGTDACDAVATNMVTSNFDFTNLVSTCGSGGSINVTYTVADDCGNTSTLTATLTIEDTTPPTIDDSGVQNIDIQCGVTPDGTLDDWLANNAGATASDNCGNVTWSNDFGSSTNVDCDNGAITVNFTASDDCGNASLISATYSIIDTVAPELTIPVNITIECDEDSSPTNTGTASAIDDCATPTITFVDSEIAACGSTKTITRTWTATDACGNIVSADQIIIVQDTTPPTLTVPADATIECSEDESSTNTGMATAIDTCGSVTITQSDVDTAACGTTKTIVRTWTATDECGNSVSETQTIVVQDTTAPTFTVPSDVILECDTDINDLSITGDVTDESDNCSTGLQATFEDSSTNGNCANETIISRTWSLTDACGNTTSLVQTISLVDTTPPTFDINLPTDISVECDVIPSIATVTAIDNCGDATVTVEETTTSGSCANDYTLTRTWTAVDACGNEVVHTQIITVTDTTAPTFTVPSDITVECDIDINDLSIVGDVTDELDNCSTGLNATYIDQFEDGSCPNEFIITREWTLTDGCNNTTSAFQIINVVDTVPPTLVTPLDTNITVACDGIPDIPNLVFQDHCSNNIEVQFEEISNPNDFEDYIVTRLWTVTDLCGNSDTFTQTINVEISNVITAFDASRCVLDTEFDLFDLLSGDFDMNGTWSVISGNASVDGSLFDPSSVEVGIYTFMYAITDGPCPNEVEVNVTIDDDCVVLPCGAEDVVISKTVTANGDTFNEFFTISGIEDCGFVIELQIFNRWGAKIYDNNNYQNDWGGEAHNSSAGDSGKVPTGTYYYVINLRNSGLKPFAGPIYVATNK
uniref:gliding motility-associated C-terminal domain-containing protein n=1 Tax=Winogradskyella flava TaxID=1884876 RepID=UPI002492B708